MPRYSILPVLALAFSACTEEQILFPPVMDAEIRGYCGSCHMAYQPSMLPAASWRLLMNSLDDHFNEKVTLKVDIQQHITSYHVTNAGDSKAAGKAGQIALQGLRKDASPLRITDTPYFKQAHHFLENRILGDWVGSAARCPVCHVGAWVGDYRR
ncbi:hypothetical protein [Kaarinaea lacus]